MADHWVLAGLYILRTTSLQCSSSEAWAGRDIVRAAAVEMHFLLAHSNDKRMAGVVSPVKYLNYEPTQAVHCFCWPVIRIMFVPFVRVILHRLVRTQRPGCYIYNSKSAQQSLFD